MSTYVPNKTYAMTVNDTGNMVFMIGERNDGARLAPTSVIGSMLQILYRNNGQRVERAQEQLELLGFPSAAQVLQILCINEVLYLLVQYGTEVSGEDECHRPARH